MKKLSEKITIDINTNIIKCIVISLAQSVVIALIFYYVFTKMDYALYLLVTAIEDGSTNAANVVYLLFPIIVIITLIINFGKMMLYLEVNKKKKN